MKQRVTFGAKDKRRDQRRPVSLTGSIDGVPVKLVDVSFAGVGGGVLELRNAAELTIGEGELTTLAFTTAEGRQVTMKITIQRIDPKSGAFGATFTALSGRQFDTIERLMFPRRGSAKA